MKDRLHIPRWLVLLAAALLFLAPGCSDSGGGSGSDAEAEDNDDSDSAITAIPDCLAVGDGLTKGVGVDTDDAWPELLEDRLGATVAVDAHGGFSVADVAGRMSELMEFDPPSHVLVLVGTNDVYDRTPLEEMSGSFQTIIDIARSYGATPILATLPALYGFGNAAVEYLFDVNAMIRSVASANGVQVARLDIEFGTDQTLLLDDGVHPSEAGHVIIMAAFYDLL